MFRRLAEGFDMEKTYFPQEQQFFNTLPNIIPSATSGLPGLDKAIATVAQTNPTNYQSYAIPNPNQIVQPLVRPAIAKAAAECASKSIDDLIDMKDSNNPNGCGWLYSPPNQGSPYPVVSRGAYGTSNGPSAIFDPPAYKKWFFNLQEAKKQTLIDKCKALQACTDVDSAVFNGVCGFCTDINQGVPVDAVGKPLFNDSRLPCTNIVTSKSQCPPPQQINGPQPVLDRTCEPINGRLSTDCLHQTVLSGGCNKNGALAIALKDGQQSVTRLATGDAVQTYNRFANPLLNISIFTDANTTRNNVLQEVRRLANNAINPATTGLGIAARDLCLKRGEINGYNPCSELSDASGPPFDMKCLQYFFLNMGGNENGTAYPNPNNMVNYNTMTNLGSIKQRWSELFAKAKGTDGYVDYPEQQQAAKAMLGINLQEQIKRAPPVQGVEVFWFVPQVMSPNKLNGFLRRTIEHKIVQFPSDPAFANTGGPSRVPQIGGGGYGCMLQLTDLRSPVDFSATFDVLVDDGFWITVNQPEAIDEVAMSQPGYTIDKPGLFENLGLQGPTRYKSGACTPFQSTTPNIMKLYHEDAGGGWAAFTFNMNACVGTPQINSDYLSLTCELKAPFLSFEVTKRGRWEETRNPGLFAQFTPLTGLDIHTRTDEQNSVPGKKSFVRLNTASSLIDLRNIAYQSWKNITIATRFHTKPVKESIINLACGPPGTWYFNVIATTSGDYAKISIEYRIGSTSKQIETPFAIRIEVWHLFRITNHGNGFSLYCDTISDVIASKGARNSVTTVTENTPLWGINATWNPAPGQAYEVADIMLGTAGYSGWTAMYGTSSFFYDVAWVHFFDYEMTDADVYRDASANWIYTQFPTEYNKYT